MRCDVDFESNTILTPAAAFESFAELNEFCERLYRLAGALWPDELDAADDDDEAHTMPIVADSARQIEGAESSIGELSDADTEGLSDKALLILEARRSGKSRAETCKALGLSPKYVTNVTWMLRKRGLLPAA